MRKEEVVNLAIENACDSTETRFSGYQNHLPYTVYTVRLGGATIKVYEDSITYVGKKTYSKKMKNNHVYWYMKGLHNGSIHRQTRR